MAFPFPIQSNYTGMWRDVSRDQLPPGSVWNLQDYFPNILGAPLRKRGGWVYGSPALSATGFIRHMIYAEFTAGSKLIAVDGQSPPVLWTIANTATATSAGALTGSGGRPVFHANKTIHVSEDGVSGVRYYDGATIGSVTAAPTGKWATVYKDRTLITNTNAQPRYVYFSAAGDPMTWDTVNGWIEVSQPPTAIAALRNLVLVFATDRVERIRGTTPPPGTDMVLEKVSDFGCDDYRSVAYWGDSVVYCDSQGVYLTDGSSTVDLTEAGGISTFWRTTLASYTTVWNISAAVFRNHYFVVLGDGTQFIDCFVCNLETRTWVRMQNFPFRCFCVAHGIFQDLYAGFRSPARLARLTDIFTPTAANKNDADGTNVLPVVEYPMARGFIRVRRRWFPSLGITTWKRMFLSYDLRDAAADVPTLRMSYVQTPEATAYTTISPDLAASTAETRAARSFGGSGARGGKTTRSMMGIKVAQVGPSSDTRIYALEGTYQTQGVGKLAQK